MLLSRVRALKLCYSKVCGACLQPFQASRRTKTHLKLPEPNLGDTNLKAKLSPHLISLPHYRTHKCGEIGESDVGKVVKVAGWLEFNRGDRMFTLTDYTGNCQVLQTDVKKLPRRDSVVMVEGVVAKRPEDAVNKNMKTGEFEITCTGENITTLNETLPLPFPLHDPRKITREELRMRYRYIDIRTRAMQTNLRLRSNFLLDLRRYLCEKHSFVEVETPTLFRKTPGGAQEFLVPTHIPGQFYSLPQSPQQFKQLLMAGGIDRYMQIAKCYRDEGARPDRQPEFTQLDIEMSFVNQEDVKKLTEDMLIECWPTELPRFESPFRRMNYKTAMGLYGSDKPDLRYDCQLKDISDELAEVTLFSNLIKEGELYIRGCRIPKGGEILSSKQIGQLKSNVENLTKINVATVKIADDGSWASPLSKFVHSDHAISKVNDKLEAQPSDLMFICAHNSHMKVCEALGKCRIGAAELCSANGQPLHKEDEFRFAWIEDFPLFENDEGQMKSAHHPFTAPLSADLPLLYSDPLAVRGEHYDLVLNGFEVGGGSIRIHDSAMQKYVLENILKEGIDTLQHLLEALEFGCPPHGGIALGLDRLLAVMCNANSIRDVIAFPKSVSGNDLMCHSPCEATRDDLNYYHIRPILSNERLRESQNRL